MSAADAVLSDLDADLPWERALYEDLHRHPELSLNEHRTAGIVEGKLRSFGYDVQRVGGTGVVGILENGRGPTLLARADMDALPVKEATGLPYASTVTATDADGRAVPVAHACGHDMHVAMLLGAAKKMADGKHRWSGTYVALFQPGEEVGAGAKAMLDDGLVHKIPKPNVAVAQHVMPGPAGRIGTTAGPILSAADSVRVVLYGKGAHGSMPHLSVDPVVLAAAVVLRLQSIVSREIAPGTFAVVTVGALQAGTKANIIADEATLLLNLRTYDAAVRDRLIASIERIVKAECEASGSPKAPRIDYYDHYPLTSNSPQANDRVTAAFADFFGPKAVYAQSPATASEDFSVIPTAFGIPYDYWCIGGTDPDRYAAAMAHHTVERDIPSNHSPSFAPVIDPTLRIGTEAQVVAALSYLAASTV